MKKTGARRNRKLRSAAAVAATVAVVTIAALIFLYRDELAPSALRESLDLSPGADTAAAAYTYESGEGQVFAAAGNCLAVASGSGLQFLDKNGNLAARELFSMQNPAVAGFDGGAAFFDVGGTALRVAYESGKTVSLDQENAILSVSANQSGELAVTTRAPGYKALLAVYNKNLDLFYKWYSGTLRVLGAHVSPKGDFVTALCLSDTGSTVQCFSTKAQDPVWTVPLPGELFLDLRYCGNNIVLLSQTRLLFLNASTGKQVGSFDFEGSHLSDYDLNGGGFVAVILDKYAVGTQEELITVSSAGLQRGETELPRGADSVSADGQNILLLSGGALTLYNAELEVRGQRDDALGFQRALLLSGGTCLLLSSFAAERETF